MNQNKIYFISGVSGVGKTSTLEHIRNLLPANLFDIRDFDERGVPDGGGPAWHDKETRHWLDVATLNSRENKNTIISGFINPEQFNKVYVPDRDIPARILLLNASSDTVRRRLYGRHITAKSKAEIERAAGTSLDEFVEQCASFAPKLRIIFEQGAFPIIDTDGKKPEAVAQEVAGIILKSSSAGVYFINMKIELNKQLDKEVYLDFRDAVIGGADFGKKILDDHPTINKENYIEYIDKFYASNKNELENTIKDTKICFGEIKVPLFLELEKYFGQDYRKEKYTCYLSIFDCNPRYIENRSFQVYYKRSHDMRKEVIAHEITHFAFYDFCHNRGTKDDSKLWELSEIFNVIFLNLPSIQNAIGAEELLFYPQLKDKLEKIKQIWIEQTSAEGFIVASLQYLQSQE